MKQRKQVEPVPPAPLKPGAGALKLNKQPLTKKQAAEFARANVQLTLSPEIIARQAELLGKQVKRTLTDPEREELEMIGRLAKTLEAERTEGWDMLAKIDP